MKIKVRNISGVDQSFQADGYNYKNVKPGEVVERDFKDEKHIPAGWEVVAKTTVDAPTSSKPKGRNAATVITENNQNISIPDNAGVVTSTDAITGVK